MARGPLARASSGTWLPIRVPAGLYLSQLGRTNVTRTTIGIKVDETVRERLRALALAKNRTPHWVLREALAEYLTREEAREKERLEDEARWNRYALTGQAVSHERVREWLEALAEGQDAECPR